MNLDRATDLGISALDLSLQSKFTTDPVAVIRDGLGLKIRAVDHLTEHREDGGACHGLSFLQDGVILYAPTQSSKRENFTLAHELAHWLIEQNNELYDWLADQNEPQRLLEALCDRIAQRLLLPETLVDSVLVGPVRAQHVLDLYGRSEASRPVCAIAIAKRLPCCGSVLLIDRATGEILHASVQPDVQEGWPTVFPWPGNTVSAGHPLLNMRRGDALTRRTYWQAPWGNRRQYYADAVCDGRRVVAVLADVDLWNAEKLHADEPGDFDRRPSSQVTCCGRTVTVRGYPCEECHRHRCPHCARCDCDRRADREAVCTGCFLRFQRHLLVNGTCEDCRT